VAAAAEPGLALGWRLAEQWLRPTTDKLPGVLCRWLSVVSVVRRVVANLLGGFAFADNGLRASKTASAPAGGLVASMARVRR
jgi:hypothetical protein